MTGKTPKRPRDPNQLAKLMIDIASGQDVSSPEPRVTEAERQAKVKGGERRAAKLTPTRRSEIAQAAAKARWGER